MRPRPSIIVILLAFLAFLLRVYRLDFVSLRGDEAFTVLFVQQPFAQMWDGIRTVEPNPPLMYLLLRAWIFVAGASEFATRYFSLFFGVLCVPLVFRLARAMSPLLSMERAGVRVSIRVGIVATFLVAINPYQIWHSQDVRNYTLWPALSLAGLIFFFKWINAHLQTFKPPNLRTPLLPYFVFTFLSLFTHYYDAFIVLAQNIFVLAIFWRRWRGLREWFVAQCVLGASFLAWALIYSNRATGYGEGSGIQGLGFFDIAQRTFSSFVLGETLPTWARDYGWIPFALAAVALWVFVLAPRVPRLAAWLLLYAAIPTLAVFALNLFRPLFLERYLNGIAPAYYLVFAFGFAYILQFGTPNPKFRFSFLTFTFLLFTFSSIFALGEYFFNPAFAKAPDWRALADYIRANRRAGDVILQNFPEMSSFYYFDNAAPVQVLPINFFPDAQTSSQLATLAKKYSRVWFIPAAPDFWDPDHFVEQWLDSQTDLQSETQLSTFHLRLYDTAQSFLPARTPTQIRAEDFATLIGYRWARVSGRTRFVFYWQARTATKKNYTVFVHALGAEGRVLAQQDNQPVNGTHPTSAWRAGEVIVDQYTLDADEPTMQIEVGLYDAATNARVTLFDANGTRLDQDRYLIEIKR